MNCSHCFTLGNKDPYKLIDHETVKAFLRSIKQNVNPKNATVYIHGGETFLAPYSHLESINKLIHQELKETKLNIIPQTNLMYEVDDLYVDFIKKQYGNQLGISWDHNIRFNSTSDNYNEELFFKNFKYLVDNGVEIAVAITVQKHLLESNIEEILPKFNGAVSLDFEFLTIFDDKTKSLKVNNLKWSEFYYRIVDYYMKNETTWSLPQIDLFTRSFSENKIYNCKCNCCQNRTFTLNCNGTLGLCPDETYVRPISSISEIVQNWSAFERKAREQHLKHVAQELHPMCHSCEFFDYCGGNCELSLFDDSGECSLSKKVLAMQKQNIGIFKKKLIQANKNLVELKS